MVKVPCDPAQVVVNHASFRVQLPTAQKAQSPRTARPGGPYEDTARIPVVGTVTRRRAPVVWSGKSAPGDPGATGLLQAVRNTGVRHGEEDPYGTGYEPGSTQVIPRIDGDGPDRAEATTGALPVVGPGHAPGEPLLPRMRSAGSAYDEEPYDDGQFADRYGDDDTYDEQDDPRAGRAGRRGDPVKHAYYPGRRMNLGVVLLPMRVFLGFISVYAGMGKLCDPVYFDGGERGSMVKWLNSLHPWALAEPLRDFALQHPVGAGLSIAFLQVIVGVLTILGLWQRLAAGVGALLSAAIIVTVSWKTVPVYDAPDIIYLAAWSPLLIAGAPVYSVDGKLAADAWRTLGPRAELRDLRRRVLRRGALIATVAVGLTLLVGALLGGAVRDADRVTVPGPGEAPRNEIPGSPLPKEPGQPGADRRSPSASGSPTQGQEGSAPASPSATTSSPGATARESSGAGSTAPSQTQGTDQAPPAQEAPAPPPATTSGPTSSGGTGGTPSGGTGDGGGGGDEGGGSEKGSGLVGGLIG